MMMMPIWITLFIVCFNTFNFIAVLVTLITSEFEREGHSNIVKMKLVIRLFS